MRLCTTLENLDNIPDGETRKIINYTAGDGIDITNGVISATGGGSSSDITIVESGSNANGTYVKYSDGRMECYKRVTQKNVRLTNSWYGLYTNENDTTVDLGNYAATFIEEPIVNITYMGGNGCWLINNNYHSATSPGKVQLCTVSSRTIGTCILDVTAKGKWK